MDTSWDKLLPIGLLGYAKTSSFLFQFKSLFSTIARKIRQKTFKEPTIPPAKKARIENVEIKITQEEREAFEKEFADYDFNEELPEKVQELQDEELEKQEREDNAAEIQVVIEGVNNLDQNNDISDEGHPIKVGLE